MELDFNKFTEISRKAVSKAYQIAAENRHQNILPEVMMVALMQEERDMVYYILQKLNVDRTLFFIAMGEKLDSIANTGNEHPDISSELYSVLGIAQQLAEDSGSEVVSVEHIFWALGTIDGVTKDVMRNFGVTSDELSAAVDSFRNGVSVDDEENEFDTGCLSFLTQYARNLIVDAAEGLIEPAIGRDVEVRHILQILSRKTKNNPILVGAPGTGKTAILEGLAHRILRGDVPTQLRKIQIYSLDLTALTAGASMQGEFEERLKSIIADVKTNSNIVLFIDEIHQLMGSGSSMNAANILKPAMARGEIKVIGATTTDEYIKYIESDKAFERRFQKVSVEEPDIDTAITILRGIKPRFENFHRVKILDEAIIAAVKLSARYINDRFLPDKAIDILDEAAAKMKIERSSVPAELDNLSRLIRDKEMERQSVKLDGNDADLSALNLEIANLREEENVLSAKWQNERIKFEELQTLQDNLATSTISYEAAEEASQYDVALRLKREIEQIRIDIREKTEEINSDSRMMLKPGIDEDDVRQIITAITGIPVNKMDEDEGEKLRMLEAILQESVKGQYEAVHKVSEVIRRNRMGFGDANKPIGSFLFLGTTGVGKTELSKALASYLFDSKEMIVRIDMSEYQQEHSVSRLFGAPPGYVGYDQGGQLTEAVRLKPYSVVLLDEVEKAHKKVFETLLQVLDDGRMTDGKGRVVNFKNTIIIMTSNMGAEELANAVSPEGTIPNADLLRQHIITMIKQHISPEFVNRIDEIVMFNPLNKSNIRDIVELQIYQLIHKFSSNGINLSFSEEAIKMLSDLGYDPSMGARPVKRAINNYIVNELSQALLVKSVSKEKPIYIDYNGDSFIFSN